MKHRPYPVPYLLLMAALLKFWPTRAILNLLPIKVHLVRVQTEIWTFALKGIEERQKAEASPQHGMPEGFEAPKQDKERPTKIPDESTTDDELIELIKKSAKGALYLDRPYPPPHNSKSLSWFGGLPTLPDGMEWPIYIPDPAPEWRSNEPVPMHFLAQIDCSDLPAFEGRELLPKNGILFFFAQTDWSSYDCPMIWQNFNTTSVLYFDGDTENLKIRRAPGDIPPCYRTEVEYRYDWLDGKEPADQLPCTFRKWPIEMKPFRSYSDTHPTEPWGDNHDRYNKLCRELQQKALVEALGKPLRFENPGLSFAQELEIPGDGFPHAWLAVDIFARLIRKTLRESHSAALYVKFDGTEDESVEALKGDYIECIIGEATAWIERAAAAPHQAVPEDAHREFLDWIERLDQPDSSASFHIDARHLNIDLWKSETETISDCLTHGPEAAALIPEAVVVAARPEQMAYATDGTRGYKRHQILGHASSVQDASWQTGKEVMLLQLDSDARMNWMWGDVGTLQFWITLDDLAARRFDHACGHLDAS